MSIKIRTLPVGSSIIDTNTRYNGETIEFVILGHNHDGRRVTTLGTKKILCIKPFDAKEPENEDLERRDYGNNRWKWSNIRLWLNSNDNIWFYNQYDEDVSPTFNGVNVTNNAYTDESGFLTNFSEDLRNALVSVTKKTSTAIIDGDTVDTTSDKVFLLSSTEVNGEVNGSGKVYEYFTNINNRLKYPTQKAVENSDYKLNELNSNNYWDWLLRDAFSTSASYTYKVSNTNTIDIAYACYGRFGIAPAIALYSTVMVEDTPDANGRYIIDWEASNPPTYKNLKNYFKKGNSYNLMSYHTIADTTDIIKNGDAIEMNGNINLSEYLSTEIEPMINKKGSTLVFSKKTGILGLKNTKNVTLSTLKIPLK